MGGKKGLSQHVPAEIRFTKRIEIAPDGCWLWTGSLRAHRYAAFMVDGKTVAAHRWSYERYVGPIPKGKQIDHMCGITRCVNPAHLRPLEPYENVRAYWREQRSTCRKGHSLTPENLVWRLGGTVRHCRICERGKQKRWRSAKRAASTG